MFIKKFGLLFMSLIIIVLWGTVISLLVWVFWNATMPHIFGLPEINYIQSFSLYMLISLLLRSTININKDND